MRKGLLLFCIAVIALSCSRKNSLPKDILPQEKMKEVLWSMINAGEFLNAYVLNKDSIDKVAESSKIYGQVFQVHQITREQFDKSYTYYREHPALMKIILDSLTKKQSPSIQPMPEQADSLRKKLQKQAEVQTQ